MSTSNENRLDENVAKGNSHVTLLKNTKSTVITSPKVKTESNTTSLFSKQTTINKENDTKNENEGTSPFRIHTDYLVPPNKTTQTRRDIPLKKAPVTPLFKRALLFEKPLLKDRQEINIQHRAPLIAPISQDIKSLLQDLTQQHEQSQKTRARKEAEKDRLRAEIKKYTQVARSMKAKIMSCQEIEERIAKVEQEKKEHQENWFELKEILGPVMEMSREHDVTMDQLEREIQDELNTLSGLNYALFELKE